MIIKYQVNRFNMKVIKHELKEHELRNSYIQLDNGSVIHLKSRFGINYYDSAKEAWDHLFNYFSKKTEFCRKQMELSEWDQRKMK